MPQFQNKSQKVNANMANFMDFQYFNPLQRFQLKILNTYAINGRKLFYGIPILVCDANTQ